MQKKAQKIALERIKILFKQAQEEFSKHPERSNRYVTLARKIAMKTKTKIPANLKKRFCKHCYSYLQPGINCRIRTKNKKVIYYCFKCKKYMRFPYLKKSK